MTKPLVRLQDLRRRMYAKAKSEPSWCFWGLFVHVCKLETLHEAYRLAKRKGGAPGVDGVTFEAIEAGGVGEFLEQLRAELVSRQYVPLPNRRQEIPKDGGKKVRVLGIPSIRDRVVQGALLLILEPIFEADFQAGSYGYRPGRTAHDAVEQVRRAISEGKTRVIDLDLKAYFDNVRHHILLRKVAERVRDRDVLCLLKLILKATGSKGVPQGGVISPRTQKATSSSSVRSRGGVRRPCLTCVANGNMFMSHAAGDQGGPGTAAERGLPSPRAAAGCRRGSTAARAEVCAVTTTSLSLPRAGPRTERSSGGCRANGSHYVQAPGEHRARAAGVRSAQWVHPRADRHKGRCGPSRRLTPTWLRGALFAGRCGSSLIARLTGSRPPNSRRRTNFWYRPELARSSHM